MPPERRPVADGTPVARVPLGASGVTLLVDAGGRVVAVEIAPR